MPQSPYQVYSAGQQVNQGPGNRYIPPTYNYRAGTAGSPRNYNEMDWNNVQSYNLPQQQNNPYQQQYMQGLRDTTSRFGQTPRLPQFGGTSPRMTIGGFPAQQRGGIDEYMGNPYGYSSGRSRNWGGGMIDEYNYPGSGNFNIDWGAGDPYYNPNGDELSPRRPQLPNFQGGWRQEAYDYARQQPWFDQENYGGGMELMGGGEDYWRERGVRPQMPNFQGGGQGGMGGWQQMLQDFFSRMGQQQQQAGPQKPGPNAPPATDPYAKIGYRG